MCQRSRVEKLCVMTNSWGESLHEFLKWTMVQRRWGKAATCDIQSLWVSPYFPKNSIFFFKLRKHLVYQKSITELQTFSLLTANFSYEFDSTTAQICTTCDDFVFFTITIFSLCNLHFLLTCSLWSWVGVVRRLHNLLKFPLFILKLPLFHWIHWTMSGFHEIFNFNWYRIKYFVWSFQQTLFLSLQRTTRIFHFYKSSIEMKNVKNRAFDPAIRPNTIWNAALFHFNIWFSNIVCLRKSDKLCWLPFPAIYIHSGERSFDRCKKNPEKLLRPN